MVDYQGLNPSKCIIGLLLYWMLHFGGGGALGWGEGGLVGACGGVRGEAELMLQGQHCLYMHCFSQQRGYDTIGHKLYY